MRYIARVLRIVLSKTSHIIRDTAHLLEMLKAVPVGPNDRLVKIDVKDFFMSGRHSALARDCMELVRDSKVASELEAPCTNEQFAHSIRSLIDVVLSNQVVLQDNKPYAVCIGSGMGMVSSGDVSDASLYNKLEKPFMLQPQVRNKYGIKFYGRFKDDIFLVSSAPVEALQELVRLMKQHSEFFKLKVDEVSKSSVVMLDVCLSKGSHELEVPLSSALYVKPTSNWRPLSADSMHHPSIHKSWPSAQVKRITSLCTDPSSRNVHLHQFFCKLENAGCIIPKANNRPLPLAAPAKFVSRYLVLPYSYMVEGLALNRGLENVRARWHAVAHRCGFELPQTRVSWKLGGTHLINILKAKDKNGRMVGEG